MRLFEIKQVLSAKEARAALLHYADAVGQTDFNTLIPVLAKHFPNAVYKGKMMRATADPTRKFKKGQYYSWSKSDQGLNAAIDDLHNGTDTLAVYQQTGTGIDVNAVLGKHDHSNEEEIVAKTDKTIKLEYIIRDGEIQPPGEPDTSSKMLDPVDMVSDKYLEYKAKAASAKTERTRMKYLELAAVEQRRLWNAYLRKNFK